jgi:hypothetical protein
VRRTLWLSVLCIVLATVFAGAAGACPLPSYNLPIPFKLYASGAAGALMMSFAIVGVVLNTRTAGDAGNGAYSAAYGVAGATLPPSLVSSFKVASVSCLVLTILAGVVGSQYALVNLNMTLFWVVFVLGFAYLVAFIGDVYAFINPWRVMCEWIARAGWTTFDGHRSYPRRLGYYPALAFYAILIWIELFGEIRPLALSLVLLAYTSITLAGAWWFGKDAWLRHAELFAVFFGLIGKMAPLAYSHEPAPDARYRVRLRKPFVALLQEPASHFSLLLFVLFMLSSTAVDGAHETLPWVNMFWKGVYPLLTPFIGVGLKQPYLLFVDIYYGWQWVMLLLSPLAYLAVYLGAIALAKLITGSATPLRTLALRFALTLVPIAFAYNMTHYFTLLLSQVLQVVPMLSDPFNLGWNLFGTSAWTMTPMMLDAGTVWHTQVGLILFGHIVSVYLAHVEALKDFPGARKAMLSQVPMLALMVVFTTVGLWILSLPISAGQVTDTAAAAAAGLTE